MIRRIIAFASKRRLQRQRHAAWLASQSAKAKGDTRRQHEAGETLTRVTTSLLRAELGR